MAAAVVKPESTVRPCPSLLTMFDVLLRYRPRSPRSGVIILGAATGPMHVQCRGRNQPPRPARLPVPPHPPRRARAPWAMALRGVRSGQSPNWPGRGLSRSSGGRPFAGDSGGGGRRRRDVRRQFGSCARVQQGNMGSLASTVVLRPAMF